jgi:hypothetical protein
MLFRHMAEEARYQLHGRSPGSERDKGPQSEEERECMRNRGY